MTRGGRYTRTFIAIAMAMTMIGCGAKPGVSNNSTTDVTNSSIENNTSDASIDDSENNDITSENNTDTSTDETTAEVITVEEVEYEAEDSTLIGNTRVESGKSGYSGTGYVAGFSQEGDACTFSIEISAEGFYDLVFTSSSDSYKENYVLVDGTSVGTIATDTRSFDKQTLTKIYLTEGTHKITVSHFWGWFNLDKLTVKASATIDKSIYKVSAKLVNNNATDEAKRLMSFLADNYGNKILAGQNCDTGYLGGEFKTIEKLTGKLPAVLGLDMIEYSPSRVANGSKGYSTNFAKQFWEAGGIVTFCWHWNAPSKYISGTWYSAFYKEHTNIDLAKIMNGQDQEGYDLLMQDIDAIAVQLKELQDAGVPVLWRPLHEASGGWFWWGASGAEAYKKLYITMYDRLTNTHGLNNLIWLWNGQDASWYPGDEYVDIIGEDLYPGEKVYSSQINKFLEAVDYTTVKKMVVMSENGCVFDPELAKRDGAMWGLFCTWGGEFVRKGKVGTVYSEQYTEATMMKKAYQSDIVLTLDELPDLKTYKIRND